MTEPRGASAPSGGWRTATVRELTHPHDRAVIVRLEVADRVDHLPGQHYVLRLSAPDGYRAQRSYSVSSAPADPLVELYVERLPDGEVSGFLAEDLQVGDELEVRGPIGGWFVWDGSGTAVGVGGGTGVVPLVAMLRHAPTVGAQLRLAVAARTWDELPYADELAAGGALVALSRQGYHGRAAARLGPDDLHQVIDPSATVFVCGSAGFAERASQDLVTLGVDADRIRVERFGPSG